MKSDAAWLEMRLEGGTAPPTLVRPVIRGVYAASTISEAGMTAGTAWQLMRTRATDSITCQMGGGTSFEKIENGKTVVCIPMSVFQHSGWAPRIA